MKEELAEATEAEREEQARYTAVLLETQAMHKAFDALRKLDERAKRRAMKWLDSAIWNVQEPPF